jgi:hypothetical protein
MADESLIGASASLRRNCLRRCSGRQANLDPFFSAASSVRRGAQRFSFAGLTLERSALRLTATGAAQPCWKYRSRETAKIFDRAGINQVPDRYSLL